MAHPRQPGLFDWEDRADKLTALGDPLVKLNAEIDFEQFRPDLDRVRERERKSPAGAKPFDVVLMFKMLVVQHLYNLSDDGLEYQIRDRLTFMRFLGLEMEDRVPDAKTVWLFREQLKVLGLVEVLFARFNEELARRGYAARSGQMIDATFVEVPRQRNNREENAKIKAGEEPEGWDDPAQAPMRRQKDTDARWANKNNETYYGYKNHVNVDQDTKLIQCYGVTAANVHDSQVFEDLVDTETTDSRGRKRKVYADSAYRSAEREKRLSESHVESQIHEKGTRAAPLTAEQKAANREKSTVRARVEHVFGAQEQMGGHRVRTVGISRAEVKIGLTNLVYNLKRLVQLEALSRRLGRLAEGQEGIGLPVAA